MSVCGRVQSSFLRSYLSNSSFTSGVRSVYKIGLCTEALTGRNQWPPRRDISTKEVKNDMSRDI